MTGMTRHVIVRGRVQGVGFRMWTEDEALRAASNAGCVPAESNHLHETLKRHAPTGAAGTCCVVPNRFSNSRRSAISTSGMLTVRPRSTRLVTP